MKAILGSAAEVERLWSAAKHVMTVDRARLSPLVFECIMYLKYNDDLWGLEEVIDANKHRKMETQAARDCSEAHTQRLNLARADISAWEDGFEASI